MSGIDYSYIETKAGYKITGKTTSDMVNAGGTTKSVFDFIQRRTGTSNAIYLGWNGSALTLQIDGSDGGYFWTSNNFNPANYQLLLPNASNWQSDSVISDRKVIGELGWRHYGNGHTIFDISNGTTPWGVAKSNVDADVPWSSSFPTLVGGNGNLTYGVRVDTARTAETVNGYSTSNLATLHTPQSFIATKTFTEKVKILGGNVGTNNTKLFIKNNAINEEWAMSVGLNGWEEGNLYFGRMNGDSFTQKFMVDNSGNTYAPNYAWAQGFAKYGSTNDYVLMGAGEHTHKNFWIQAGDGVTRALGFSGGNINDAPYIYTSSGTFVYLATQAWVNNQIPPVNNGQINYTGTGNIQGGGVSNANQSANTNYTFDLTVTTKEDIQSGVQAYNWGVHEPSQFIHSAGNAVFDLSLYPTVFEHNVTLKSANQLDIINVGKNDTVIVRNIFTESVPITVNGGQVTGVITSSTYIFHLNSDGEIILTKVFDTTEVYN